MTDEPPLRRRAAESRTGDASPHPSPAVPEPADAGSEPTAGGPVPLTAPREGTPAPVAAPAQLDEVVTRFAAGTGPVALDAERASGYRYSQRAYLVQLRRAGAGTVLIDPLPLPDLSALDAAIAEAEWVLHAASQDLACLAELGLRPRRLFDTELAARLAGFERVGLAALTEQLLGYTLEKHHSAADWSSRPLPESWLTYAALDVEMLVDLRDALDEELRRQGKSEWAAEEFAALVRNGARPPRTRAEPWRRTSGIHRVRGARAQARVRSLWYARDQIAARRDAAPGRVLPDSAIVAAAELDPKDEKTLLTLPGFGGRSVRRLARTWLAALDDARQLPDDALPVTPVVEGPPPPHRWAERDPVAAGRLARCREVVVGTAGAHDLPPENLVAPDYIRRLAWQPPEEITDESVAEVLRTFGAREWQITLLLPALTQALHLPAS
ncbi:MULTISPECIES: ribonuclease D [Micromonospora]|uniref:Ribonuclease D n=1 Tax=Micromonospora solifontis TaxID=2487138 RepID=A0ABX9WM17_9ACTN|nr:MULTISPECIES: ribonuclease D [Micromonospora]NES12923.1 ribonuclease D [Micromonospora sp. PPF5-17B]NES34759.1 ribonuclease D [Micromonospora solifontis]NES54848.1 ribonuclease D [Micromonospora sp. PPF5-6]RNM01662.1 ribonuclease D [Micromonospora solifontis]